MNNTVNSTISERFYKSCKFYKDTWLEVFDINCLQDMCFAMCIANRCNGGNIKQLSIDKLSLTPEMCEFLMLPPAGYDVSEALPVIQSYRIMCDCLTLLILRDEENHDLALKQLKKLGLSKLSLAIDSNVALIRKYNLGTLLEGTDKDKSEEELLENIKFLDLITSSIGCLEDDSEIIEESTDAETEDKQIAKLLKFIENIGASPKYLPIKISPFTLNADLENITSCISGITYGDHTRGTSLSFATYICDYLVSLLLSIDFGLSSKFVLVDIMESTETMFKLPLSASVYRDLSLHRDVASALSLIFDFKKGSVKDSILGAKVLLIYCLAPADSVISEINKLLK